MYQQQLYPVNHRRLIQYIQNLQLYRSLPVSCFDSHLGFPRQCHQSGNMVSCGNFLVTNPIQTGQNLRKLQPYVYKVLKTSSNRHKYSLDCPDQQNGSFHHDELKSWKMTVYYVCYLCGIRQLTQSFLHSVF